MGCFPSQHIIKEVTDSIKLSNKTINQIVVGDKDITIRNEVTRINKIHNNPVMLDNTINHFLDDAEHDMLQCCECNNIFGIDEYYEHIDHEFIINMYKFCQNNPDLQIDVPLCCFKCNISFVNIPLYILHVYNCSLIPPINVNLRNFRRGNFTRILFESLSKLLALNLMMKIQIITKIMCLFLFIFYFFI